MSDDTPTRRFDQPGADAPTERFDSVPPPHEPGDGVAESGDPGEKKSRRLLIILIALGAAILLAILIVLIVLLTRGSGTPTAADTATPSPTATSTPSPTATNSPTPSATPTPAPTQTVTPPTNDVAITSFTANTTSQCSSQTQNPVSMEISWTSENGIAAYFGVNTDDAEANGQGWTLPPSGNQNDFPNGYVPYHFECGNASIDYTITVVGTNGDKQSKRITVENTGDQF